MKSKMKLKDLEVKSFTTSLTKTEEKTIMGALATQCCGATDTSCKTVEPAPLATQCCRASDTSCMTV
ncbi:MAG: pinensin family lanthipeptide [Bacteroidetes bacterium]|nr:pinensin family lanthipeptide [Bacteroidota bacterium]